jgi:hypothetical protein
MDGDHGTDRDEGAAGHTRTPPRGGGMRTVRIPIVPPAGGRLTARPGGDRLVAALADVVRSAMALDAAGRAGSPPPPLPAGIVSGTGPPQKGGTRHGASEGAGG